MPQRVAVSASAWRWDVWRWGCRSLLTLALWLVACTPNTPAASPEAVVQQYAAALRAGDADRAYDLLSDEAREGISRAAFRRMLNENRAAADQLAQELEQEVQSRSLRARLTTPGGDTLELVWEEGAWRAESDAIDLYSQATPKKALQTLIRAYRARRFDILLRLAPRREVAELSAATLQAAWDGPLKALMDTLVSSLEETLPFADVEELGDRATVRYGAGSSLLMIRERGQWRIEELEGGPEVDNPSPDVGD